MNNNNSLKEYYIKLEELYNNAVNMLTAINQSLSTTASEITINLSDNEKTTSVRIPSFLYLENKIETLDNNFSALFNMPESGEAWFHKSSNMYKLNMVKSNNAPIIPKISKGEFFANAKTNNMLKDLVNPKTFLKLDINNIPDNISKIFMKKLIFFNKDLYDEITKKNIKKYEDYKAVLYNLKKDIDYAEYDSVLDMPIKKDEFNSRFEIIEIPELESGNPYSTNSDSSHNHLIYKLRLNTLQYTNAEDSSISFTLKQGDLLSLENEHVIYKVINVSNHKTDNLENEYIVTLEEYVGHIALQTIDENSAMILKLHNEDYSKYHYVEIPLEENPYLCIFIGTIYNNVQSMLSDAILIDLTTILMKDEHGQYIFDTNSSEPLTYIQFYNKYCKNVGDLILGISNTAFPQLSNYSNAELKELQESENIKNIVSATIDNEKTLVVRKINSHLIDDVTSENIINLHSQKGEINSQLSAVQANIDQVYNQLITTDFNQEISVTQASLRAKLDNYYQERINLQKQQIAIIDNINTLKGDAKGLSNSKFRIRGVSNSEILEKALHEKYGNKCDIIGLEIQYKYKSINSDTTNVADINSSIFSDWNRQINNDKERKLVFDTDSSAYKIEYENYDTTTNTIKWNQIDIPINQGEDVIVRIRYKYSIGQPFFNLYTPWSDNINVVFPAQFTETTEISTILSDNEKDTIGAKFNATLINDGYQEHINNKIIDNSQIFYHLADNIYSGFNTPENKLISLKDKLQEILNDVESYKSLVNNELNSEYKVYLEWNNNAIELSNNTDNNININDMLDNENDRFIKKHMNIVIKNTGSVPINFYSIFPGNVNTPLLLDDEIFYEKHLVNYERVPLLIGESNMPSENIYYQTLGQWIYFRQNNAYTMKDIYYSSNEGRMLDVKKAISYKPGDHVRPDGKTLYNYIGVDKQQGILGYRKRANDGFNNALNTLWDELIINDKGEFETLNKVTNDNVDINYDKTPIDFFIPIDNESIKLNEYLLCYEHICGIDSKSTNNSLRFMSEKSSISDFISKYRPKLTNSKELVKENLCGAFLIPHIASNTQLLCTNESINQFMKLNVGKSVSIPVKFEYYLDGKSLSSISKTLCFDLRSSLMKDPEHYVLNVTAKYDYSDTNKDMNNMQSLVDSLTIEK